MILSPFPVARDLFLVVEIRRGCSRIGGGGGEALPVSILCWTICVVPKGEHMLVIEQ